MSHGHRPDRVGDQIRKELSALLTRGAVHDPGIGFITLTRVTVTPDLQLARVYYTSMGDELARRNTARALARATPFFRRQVGGRLQLRRVPELEFRFDESIASQDRIEQILRDLHAEEEQRAADPDGIGGDPAPEAPAADPDAPGLESRTSPPRTPHADTRD
jgi:ribosome-binding factor A